MTAPAMEEDQDSDGHSAGSERRSAPRITARSLVEVRLPTWDALRNVYMVNISQGGLRLSIGAGAPIGTVIDIILTLPDGTRLHLPGKVAHLGPSESGDIGVRFDDLPEGTRQQMEGYVKELAAGRTPMSKTKSIPPGMLIKKKS
jgi:Tfp pilus assembly protein PilZ